jgi:hypothetical protein
VGPFGGNAATGGRGVRKAPARHAAIRGGGHEVVHLLRDMEYVCAAASCSRAWHIAV